MILTERKELSYNELDFKGLWKTENIFLTMQEAAGKHAAQLGASYDELKKKGVAWVLIRTSLKMDRYPGYHTPVNITTGRNRSADCSSQGSSPSRTMPEIF